MQLYVQYLISDYNLSIIKINIFNYFVCVYLEL